MFKEILSKSPSRRDLSVFLGIWAGIFAVFLAFGLFKDGEFEFKLLVAVGVSLFLMLLPQISTPLYKAWLIFGECVGFCVSRVILAVIFFGIFTPISVILGLFGRDVLGQKLAFKSKNTSFFKRRQTQPGSMKNQF